MIDNKLSKKIFIVIGIVTALLPFIIFIAVYIANIKQIPIYEKKDVLAYYGSTIGACFTGFITAGGLYFTLYQNAEALKAQWRNEKKNREEDKINAVMPVLKVKRVKKEDGLDMNLKANCEFTPGVKQPDDHIKLYIKNIGIGPAINIKIKLGDYYANNSTNLINTFDLGVDEKVVIDIRTAFSSIEQEIDEKKQIIMILEFEDVYFKRIYRYYINIIKVDLINSYNTFENKKKETIKVI
ncbi:hypothetical protein [Clostridium saccharoperbutylacetonicum]